jgi:hypothetical protein
MISVTPRTEVDAQTPLEVFPDSTRKRKRSDVDSDPSRIKREEVAVSSIARLISLQLF